MAIRRDTTSIRFAYPDTPEEEYQPQPQFMPEDVGMDELTGELMPFGPKGPPHGFDPRAFKMMGMPKKPSVMFTPDPMSPSFSGPPPAMGPPSIPAGAAGIKTPTMTMPSGGGYPSGGSPGSLGPDPMTSGAPHVPSAEEEAAKWDIELPAWSKTEAGPSSVGEWKEDSYTYRPEMTTWAKDMGMTPEMWTKGGEGLTPYDPRYVSHGAGGPGSSSSILPMARTDPEFHAMGTPDPFYYVRPGGKERLAETGKFRDFSRGGEWRSPPPDARGRRGRYIGGRESDGKAWFANPVTEFTPSWLTPGMTSWPGMP